jgi:hypothetical protein
MRGSLKKVKNDTNAYAVPASVSFYADVGTPLTISGLYMSFENALERDAWGRKISRYQPWTWKFAYRFT